MKSHHLPRQARDKHEDSGRRKTAFHECTYSIFGFYSKDPAIITECASVTPLVVGPKGLISTLLTMIVLPRLARDKHREN
jgi:hypothetical protein